MHDLADDPIDCQIEGIRMMTDQIPPSPAPALSNLLTELKPCPFCNAELTAPTPVQHPKSGLAQLHPGSVDDGSCPIAGWGFYDEQLEHWNTRAAEEGITP